MAVQYPLWYWKSSHDPFLYDEDEQWTPYGDIDNEIIEISYRKKDAQVELDNYIIDLHHLIQISKQNKRLQRQIKRLADGPVVQSTLHVRFYLDAELPIKSIGGIHWYSSRFVREWAYQFKPVCLQQDVSNEIQFIHRGYQRGFTSAKPQARFIACMNDNPRKEYEYCEDELLSRQILESGLPSALNEKFPDICLEEGYDCQDLCQSSKAHFPRPCKGCRDHMAALGRTVLAPPMDKLWLVEDPPGNFFLILTNESSSQMPPLSDDILHQIVPQTTKTSPESDHVSFPKNRSILESITTTSTISARGKDAAYRYFDFTLKSTPYRLDERCSFVQGSLVYPPAYYLSSYGDLWIKTINKSVIAPHTERKFSGKEIDLNLHKSKQPFLRLELNDSSYPSCSNLLWVAYQNEGDPTIYSELEQCGEQLSRDTNTPLLRVTDSYQAILERNGKSSDGYRSAKPWQITEEHRLFWLKYVVDLACDGILEEGTLLGQMQTAQFIVNHLKLALEYDQLWSQCPYLYTRGSFLHTCINQALIHDDIGKLRTLGPFCYLLHWSLCPSSPSSGPFTGEVYRGMELDTRMIEQYKEAIGTYRSWLGFSSTSQNRLVSERMGNTLFVLNIQNGWMCRDIASISQFEQEEEVLISAGTVFQITSVEFDETRSRHVIHLEISSQVAIDPSQNESVVSLYEPLELGHKTHGCAYFDEKPLELLIAKLVTNMTPPIRETYLIPNSQVEMASKRLFHAIETNDVYVLEALCTDIALFRRLCQIRQFFESQWSEPQLELQSTFERACLLGRICFVQLMIETGDVKNQILGHDHGSDFTANSQSTMRYAMLFACQSGNVDVIRLLLQNGGSPDSWGSCTNSYAARTFRIKEEYSCSHKATTENVAVWTNVYALFFMIIQDNPMLKEFITQNTAKHYTDVGHTALHVACICGSRKEIMDALLDAGVDPATKTQDEKYADELLDEHNALKQYMRIKRDAAYRKREGRNLLDLENLERGIGFQIFVKTLNGKSIVIVTNKDEKTEDIKRKVHEKLGIPTDEQKLIFRGKQLQDGRWLHEYDVQNNSTLHLTLRLRGGVLL